MSSNPSKKTSKHPARNPKKSGKPSSARSTGHRSADSSKSSKNTLFALLSFTQTQSVRLLCYSYQLHVIRFSV